MPRSLGCAGAFLALSILAVPLAAAPRLVVDQNPGLNVEPQTVDFGTAAVVPRHGAVYFAATDPDHGRELWRSDGTTAGTRRLTDLCVGRCDSSPGSVTEVQGQLFFTADDGVSGRELWRSDGTPGGERRVRDLCPGPCGTEIRWMAPLGDRLLFLTAEGDRRVLWSTNGSRRGTVPITTVCTALPEADCLPFGGGAQTVGGWVFFAIYPHPSPDLPIGELWRSDGTVEGTGPLSAVVDEEFPTYRVFPALGAGFFWTRDALWRTDGTAAGTVPLAALRDLREEPDGDSSPGPTAVWDGAVYLFLSGGEIVRSDGTPAGTVRIARLGPDVYPAALTPTAAGLFFLSGDPGGGNIYEVWRTQGTAATTEKVASTFPDSIDDRTPTAAGGRLIFGVHKFSPGGLVDLWSSDGTAANTGRIGRIGRNLLSGYGQPPVSLGDRALFAHGDDPDFDELWQSDGTEQGTRLVRDFTAVPAGGGPRGEQAVLGGRLLYPGWAYGDAPRMIASDGTAAGTRVLLSSARWPRELKRVGDQLFFAGGAFGNWASLWSTDGTPAGTARIVPQLSFLGSFSALGQQLLFGAQSPGLWEPVGFELWHSNGKPGGSGLVRNIDPFTVAGERHSCTGESSSPGAGVALGGALLFAANDGVHGRELWRSDGTAAGSRLVRDIHPGRIPADPDIEDCNDRKSLGLASNPEGLFRFRNGVLFTADDGSTGRELWWTDGTAVGTRRVKDLRPGADGSSPHDLAVFRQRVYFIAATDGAGESLWSTDGTTEGTVRVHDLTLGGTPSWARSLTAAGGHLFVSVYNEATGEELWASDGTAEGTALVADLRPGAPSASPRYLTAAGGVLIFAADDGEHGLEPWRSDGTAAGTRRLADLSPGRDASSPGPFSILGDDILTGADDGVHGRELWAIPVEDVTP
jgi:ELWxxDGT repeat protein